MRTLHVALITLLLAAGAGGCRPGAFGDLEDKAPTRALGGGQFFGKALATYTITSPGGQLESRLAVTSGRGSSYQVYDGWVGGLQLGSSLFDGCETDCDGTVGAEILAIPEWTFAGGAGSGTGCIGATAPGNGTVHVVCESLATDLFQEPGGMTGIELGASGIGLDSGNPLGVALLGAPLGANGDVYRLPNGASPVPLNLAMMAGGMGLPAAGAQLGTTVGAFRPPGRDTVIAAGANGGGFRVVVATAAASDGAVNVVNVLSSPDAGFGEALLVRDIDGAGDAEILVGGHGRIDVFSLGSTTPDQSVLCENTPETDCASDFGDALAVGDVDADGDLDLIVGAPGTTVDGTMAAGALFVYPREGSGFTTPGRVLVHSNPESEAGLGSRVAALPTVLEGPRRDEPVGSAPGAEAVYVFLCTGLPGDMDATNRCLP